MRKYSIAWKQAQQEKKQGWKQYHRDEKMWYWHYIQYDTEYSRPL